MLTSNNNLLYSIHIILCSRLHNGPLQQLDGSRPATGISVQETDDDILQRCGNITPLNGDWVTIQDLALEFIEITREVGEVTSGEEVVEDDAQGVHVSSLGVGLAEEDFRGEVEWRASSADDSTLVDISIELLGNTKVGDLGEVETGEENVGSLEIPVNDVVTMEVLDSKNNLNKDEENVIC